MTSSPPDSRYHGFKDICILCAETLNALFPIPLTESTSKQHKSRRETCTDVLPVDEWLAYVFYRTNAPYTTIFHALRLLERLSSSFSLAPISQDTPKSRLLHHRLIFSALVLSFCFHMDDNYSNKSFAVASKGLFNVREINELQFELMSALDWQIGEPNLVEIIEGYIRDWEERLWQEKKRRQRMEMEQIPQTQARDERKECIEEKSRRRNRSKSQSRNLPPRLDANANVSERRPRLARLTLDTIPKDHSWIEISPCLLR
ncbi:hypothetical protein BT69DRAFT_1279383 [Atractiella rhizophila]|nr:hypothetical protein BT69DRAFT_1279383 [Atractiella rhizophila]